MANSEKLQALQEEYLAISREIYQRMANKESSEDLRQLQLQLNTILETIKLLENDDPTQLFRD